MVNGDLWKIRKEAADALYGYYQVQENPVTANFPGEIRTRHISNETAKRSTPACSIIFRYYIQGFNQYSSFVLAPLYFCSFLDTWIITWNIRCIFVCLFVYLFVFGAAAPQWARAFSFTRFLDHTQRRTTVSRTPLDEWSARRRDLNLTTHNTHNKYPCPRWDSNPQSQQASGRRPTP